MRIILLICILFVTNNLVLSQPEIIDGVTKKTLMKEKQVLPYPNIRESDIFWEKRIWRVIDVREKMNLHFMYPQAPFFEILKTGAMNGEITLYSANDDKFSEKVEDFEGIFVKHDTTSYIDENGNLVVLPFVDDVNYENIKRFRVKEVWFLMKLILP